MDAVAEGRNLAPDSLWRRYSEFELLRNYLIVCYPYIVVPPLPEKRVSSGLPLKFWFMLTCIFVVFCSQYSFTNESFSEVQRFRVGQL